MRQTMRQIKALTQLQQQTKNKSILQDSLKTRMIDKMQQIKSQLNNYEYQKKFNLLNQNYVFNFDMSKVIKSKNIELISKFCSSFFSFLVLRMLYYYYDQIFPSQLENKESREYSLKNQIKNSKLKPKVATQDRQYRQNKARANTTVTLSKQSNFQAQKSLQQIKTSKGIINKSKERVQNLIDWKNKFQQQMHRIIAQADSLIKQYYFQLTQSINNRYRVAKLQIISFLVVLIAPDILRSYSIAFQRQFKSFLMHNLQKPKLQIIQQERQVLRVQQEIHIVLTFQTLGNLVSPNVFRCLKKKYIKQSIFVAQSAQQSVKLMQSLRHIKQKLKSNKNMIFIKGRRNDQKRRNIHKTKSIDIQYDQMFSKQKIKQFIKQALKTKQTNNTTQNISNKISEFVKQNKFQTFYPLCKNQKSQLKNTLINSNVSNKKSISISTKLNLQTFKQNNASKQLKRKKCVQAQKTFFKLKTVTSNKKQGSKAIKSQRSSCKFNRINCENTPIVIAPGIFKSQFQKQPAQQMKIKIQQFKSQALKDLQTMQNFRQSLSLKQIRKDIIYSQNRAWNLLKINDSRKSIQRQDNKSQLIKRVNESKKHLDCKLSTKQRQQVWHQMYNIRYEPIIPLIKQVSPPRVSYKFSKNSDMLKKNRKIFNEDCKRRIQLIEDDIDLVTRMRMGVR